MKIYDSYNVDLASRKIGRLKVENIANSYFIVNNLKFNLTNEHNKNEGYTGEFESLRRDESNLNLCVILKSVAAQK